MQLASENAWTALKSNLKQNNAAITFFPHAQAHGILRVS